MRPLRILLVSSAPLRLERGAGQTATGLAGALSARGHDIEAWWPGKGVRGRDPALFHGAVRRVVASRLHEREAPEILDVPALWLPEGDRPRSYSLVRSIQPELLYLDSERAQARPPSLVHRVYWSLSWRLLRNAIVAGWKRADRILCLGSVEREWMATHFPTLAPRLAVYSIAPPEGEREVFRVIAKQRPCRLGRSVRWLWIGRWAAHKGPSRLVDLIRRRMKATEDSFTIAGCGPIPEGAIEDAWVRGGRVRVVEVFSRGELPALLASHDAGLMTSDVEGWGISLQEMLESGMPVWATRTGAVPDLEPHFSRLLFPFPPPDGGLEGIELGTGSGIGYATEFSWDHIAERYETMVLEDLARRRKG